MSIVKTGEHKFKFVKKAGLYCETWFEIDKSGKPVQKQKWLTKQEYEML
jgi:hypothetical protein